MRKHFLLSSLLFKVAYVTAIWKQLVSDLICNLQDAISKGGKTGKRRDDCTLRKVSFCFHATLNGRRLNPDQLLAIFRSVLSFISAPFSLGWLDFFRSRCRLDMWCRIGHWSTFTKTIFWFNEKRSLTNPSKLPIWRNWQRWPARAAKFLWGSGIRQIEKWFW